VRLSALLDRYKRDGRSRPKRYDPV